MSGVPSPEQTIREALILAQSLPLSVPEAHFENLKRLDALVLQTHGAPAFAALDALVVRVEKAEQALEKYPHNRLLALRKECEEARAERDAAVERTHRLTAALLDLRTMLTGMAPTGVKLGRVLDHIDVALAAVGEPLSEPRKNPEPVDWRDLKPGDWFELSVLTHFGHEREKRQVVDVDVAAGSLLLRGDPDDPDREYVWAPGTDRERRLTRCEPPSDRKIPSFDHPGDSFRMRLRELFESFDAVPELVKVLKIGEEFGEASEAVIGMYAFNPRKGKIGGKDDVAKELADVAITAMVALHHFSAEPVQRVTSRLTEVHARALAASEQPSEPDQTARPRP